MTPSALVAAGLIAACIGLVAAIAIPRLGRILGYVGLFCASITTLAGAIVALGSGATTVVGDATSHVVLQVDPTTAFFDAIVSAIASIVSLYLLAGPTLSERATGRAGAAAAALIFIGSIVVCSAGDVFFLLFGWEVVALAFYWAIAYAGTDPGAARAAYYTLVLTHVAGAGLFAALLPLAHAAGADTLGAVATAAQHVAPMTRGLFFFLLLFGFGAKIGLIPLQGWLPYGYSAAPPAIAALMAGGALNIGFYGIVRFLIGFGGPIVIWWALVVIALGAVGALFGIAWSQAQRDVRPLAALSSVENAGLIVIGLGIALLGRALDNHLLTGLGLIVAYVHIAAHAFAKALLFLCASGLHDATGSTSFERLGGQLRRLPLHATTGLVAAMSLAALPPLAGFVSEWLVLEACMQAFRTANRAAEVTLALTGATVGIAAGIAVVTFVKFVGVALLGAPRSAGADVVRRDGSPLRGIALVANALAVVALGVFTPSFVRWLTFAVDPIAGVSAAAAVGAEPLLVQPAFKGFSSASGAGLAWTIALSAVGFAIIVALIGRPASRREEAWTSGNTYEVWTQYTGTGFANPTRVILNAAIRTDRTISSTPYAIIEPAAYESAIRPYFDLPLASRIGAAFLWVSALVRKTQSGVIALYLSYILGFAIAALMLYPSLRRW